MKNDFLAPYPNFKEFFLIGLIAWSIAAQSHGGTATDSGFMSPVESIMSDCKTCFPNHTGGEWTSQSGALSVDVRSPGELHIMKVDPKATLSNSALDGCVEMVLARATGHKGLWAQIHQAYLNGGKQKLETSLHGYRVEIGRISGTLVGTDDFGLSFVTDAIWSKRRSERLANAAPSTRRPVHFTSTKSTHTAEERPSTAETTTGGSKEQARVQRIDTLQEKTKATRILNSALDLRQYLAEDTRLRDETREELQLNFVLAGADRVDCVNVEVHLVPKANWKSIRITTLVRAGATPSEAMRIVNPKPVTDTIWATFRVNLKTGTVGAVDNWASQILAYKQRQDERSNYLQNH